MTGWVSFGDSTTFGAGASDLDSIAEDDKWQHLVGIALGVTIANLGSSGARSDEITARIGGLTPRALVHNGVLPAAGSVEVTMLDLDPLRASNVSSYDVVLHSAGTDRDVAGTLSRDPKSDRRLFTSEAPGGTSMVPGLVEVVSRFPSEHRGGVVFVGMGINDEPLLVRAAAGNTRTVADVKQNYRDAIAALAPTGARIIVWGVLDRGPAEARGTVTGDYIAELEQWLETNCGADDSSAEYLPLRRYLSSAAALADAARLVLDFEPSAADNEAVERGTVPPAFRVAPWSVHLNGSLGHRLQAGYFVQNLR